VADDEDRILREQLGAVGAIAGKAAGFGARLVARFLRKNVYETTVTMSMAVPVAAEQVDRVLRRSGRLLEPQEQADSTASQVQRVIVGGGFGNMNPVLITVRLTESGADRTAVSVRGAALEGLIKQRAGEKTAACIAELLAKRRHAH
jgi:carbon monoxide dehydrogenase subunit G